MRAKIHNPLLLFRKEYDIIMRQETCRLPHGSCIGAKALPPTVYRCGRPGRGLGRQYHTPCVWSGDMLGSRPQQMIWACSAVGSALHSHCRGRGFESLQVHHPKKITAKLAVIFCLTSEIPQMDFCFDHLTGTALVNTMTPLQASRLFLLSMQQITANSLPPSP